MSSNGQPPAVPQPAPHEIQLPLVLVNGTALRIEQLVGGQRVLVIGPLCLGLPLGPDAERFLRDNLNASGIIVPGAIAKLPADTTPPDIAA